MPTRYFAIGKHRGILVINLLHLEYFRSLANKLVFSSKHFRERINAPSFSAANVGQTDVQTDILARISRALLS